MVEQRTRRQVMYTKERERIFTEEGQQGFLAIRDRVQHLLRDAGACTMGKAIEGSVGDTWLMLACVERLVELGEREEETQGQDQWIRDRGYRQEGRRGREVSCKPWKTFWMCCSHAKQP